MKKFLWSIYFSCVVKPYIRLMVWYFRKHEGGNGYLYLIGDAMGAWSERLASNHNVKYKYVWWLLHYGNLYVEEAVLGEADRIKDLYELDKDMDIYEIDDEIIEKYFELLMWTE